MPTISVCMATYNGERYLSEQLLSILKQLGEKDEVIISDDSSTDGTVALVKGFQDSRIRLIEKCTFKSPVFNFENAMRHATGDVIVLADQDDIWLDGKLDLVRSRFAGRRGERYLIVMDNYVVDGAGGVTHDSLFGYLNSGKGLAKNFVRNTYLGCNMAFTRELLQVALPFPASIPMHDIWLGLIGELYAEVEFVEEKTMLFRRHGNNATKRSYSFMQKVKWRSCLFYHLMRHACTRGRSLPPRGVAAGSA